jgi:tRNA (guanine37-N1)-methyltransferase
VIQPCDSRPIGREPSFPTLITFLTRLDFKTVTKNLQKKPSSRLDEWHLNSIKTEHLWVIQVAKAPCLKVLKLHGETAIALAKKFDIFERKLKVQRVGDHLYIPLVAEPLQTDLKELEKELPEFEVSSYEFPERVKRQLKLIDLLEDKLPPHLLANLPHAIDFVGDIAVVEIPPELENYKRIIGEAMLSAHKRVNTVLAKSGAVEGVYRVRKFKVIAGADRTEAVHKEHGCVFHVDLARAYFSPRLSAEHSRIAAQVEQGETVIDMFAGVGPFSILIAKKCADVKIYAIDVNPDAFRYLKRNIKANNVEAKVKPILGDARQIVKEKLRGTADRVIMNLPEKAIEYVDIACEALQKEGGIIHYYEFTNAPNPLEAAKNRFDEAMKLTSRSLEKILMARTVRATAPYTWQVVVDAEIR